MDVMQISQSSGVEFNSVLMSIDTFNQKPARHLMSHSTQEHPQIRKEQEELEDTGSEEQRSVLEEELECIDGPYPFC